MTPDPQGTRPAGLPEVGATIPVAPSPVGPYDRSSLRGDFLVMIPDQTVEAYLRRHPRDRRCELIDGTVYLHVSERDEEDPAEVYDRSSLSDDLMVMIPDQSEEDYLRLRPEKGRCEYIDGVVYMHAAPSYKHQFDTQFLLVLLEMFNAVREVGVILSGPAEIRLRPGAYVQPDAFVLPPGIGRQLDILTTHPPALLLIEILSPTTRTYDLNQKLALYREADAAEVWLVDGRDKVVIVDRRKADGRETRKVKSGPLHSVGLPGFWFDVDWLWADPRPNLMRCLDQILAGPPA